MKHRVKAIYVIGAAPFAELAQAFVDAIKEILTLSMRHEDPFIAKVYRADPSRKQRVQLWLTFARWLKLG